MLALTSKLLPLRLALLLIVTLSAAMLTRAQTVVYDWSSNSKVPESYPKITRKQLVTFNIKNVNDILYSYRLEVTQTPMDDDDFKAIAGILNGFRSQGPSPAPSFLGGPACVTPAAFADALANARDSVQNDPLLPIGYAAAQSKTSVSLAASRSAWDTDAKEARTLAELRPCTALPPALQTEYDTYKSAVTHIQKKVDGSHVFSATSEISPGNNVSATVFEIFGTDTISSKTFTFPGTDVLTLSAGALFSTIPDRTYEARKTPNSTLNVLTVEGNSRATPAVVALLNYSLGAFKLDRENFGLALSAGPVIRLGAKSDTSTFGFFTGLSGNLYHRFYITPGIHFGQFSDFPVGFGNGSSVPANFGELTPVKRWTGRFGLAITFKTKDFSGLTSSDTPSVTGGEANAEATPTPSPSASPSGGSNAITFANASSSIARSFLRPTPVSAPVNLPTEVAPNAADDEISETAQEGRVEFSSHPRPTASSHRVSMSNSRSPVLHVTSLSASIEESGIERISINASALVANYGMYFREGRLYLVIPRARIDIIQDGLTGQIFSDPMVEKRSNDLVLSFVLLPGTKTRVVERSNGLNLVLIPSSTN